MKIAQYDMMRSVNMIAFMCKKARYIVLEGADDSNYNLEMLIGKIRGLHKLLGTQHPLYDDFREFIRDIVHYRELLTQDCIVWTKEDKRVHSWLNIRVIHLIDSIHVVDVDQDTCIELYKMCGVVLDIIQSALYIRLKSVGIEIFRSEKEEKEWIANSTR